MSNKKIDKKKNDLLTRRLVILSSISGFLGIIILLFFLFVLSKEYTFYGNNKLLLDKTAQVGDFIGGFVGAIWSLTGILLFYLALRLQRKEFALQRNEFQLQRKEFQINRITNIIYHQLEKLEFALNKLSLKLKRNKQDDYEFFSGKTALIILGNSLSKVSKLHDIDKLGKEAVSKEVNILIQQVNNLLHSNNISQLTEFAIAFYDSTDVIREVLLREDIEINELNGFKNLYFRNFGFVSLETINKVVILISNCIEFSENHPDRIKKKTIELEKLIRTRKFLKNINNYKELIITEEYINKNINESSSLNISI